MQQHGATRMDVFARPARDGERGIRPIVKVWAFNCDLPLIKEGGPETLPLGLPGGNRARALPVIHPHLLRIRGIEDGIVEAQDVTKRHVGWMELLHGVGQRVFDDVYRVRVTCLCCRAAAYGGKQITRNQPHQESEGASEKKQFLHADFPFE